MRLSSTPFEPHSVLKAMGLRHEWEPHLIHGVDKLHNAVCPCAGILHVDDTYGSTPHKLLLTIVALFIHSNVFASLTAGGPLFNHGSPIFFSSC